MQQEDARDNVFIRWIINEWERADSADREMSLWMLKFDSGHSLSVIEISLPGWIRRASQELGQEVSFNPMLGPQIIINALKEHFAEDLAKITQVS